MKDDLSGLDKAIGAVLGQRTIERNQLLVTIAKSKLSKSRDDKIEKVTKPEELVRLYDLLLQVKNYLLCIFCLFLTFPIHPGILEIAATVLVAFIMSDKTGLDTCSYFLQNTADLSDLVSSGRDRKSEELAFAEECALKSLVFRAERFASY